MNSRAIMIGQGVGGARARRGAEARRAVLNELKDKVSVMQSAADRRFGNAQNTQGGDVSAIEDAASA